MATQIVHSACHNIIKSHLEADTEYQNMITSNLNNTIALCQLVKKTCNGLTCVVVDDALGNVVESLHNFILIRGEEYLSSPKKSLSTYSQI